jgi:hypothetical protein
MEGNEEGIEKNRGEMFNKPCLRVFFCGREKNLKGLGVRCSSKPLIFNSIIPYNANLYIFFKN